MNHIASWRSFCKRRSALPSWLKSPVPATVHPLPRGGVMFPAFESCVPFQSHSASCWPFWSSRSLELSLLKSSKERTDHPDDIAKKEKAETGCRPFILQANGYVRP